MNVSNILKLKLGEVNLGRPLPPKFCNKQLILCKLKLSNLSKKNQKFLTIPGAFHTFPEVL